MMPSFSLVLIGAAAAKQVQATATTRTKVLTARFMAFSLHAGPLGAETLSGWNYIPTVKPVFSGMGNSSAEVGAKRLAWQAGSGIYAPWVLEKARSTMCSNIGINDSVCECG